MRSQRAKGGASQSGSANKKAAPKAKAKAKGKNTEPPSSGYSLEHNADDQVRFRNFCRHGYFL